MQTSEFAPSGGMDGVSTSWHFQVELLANSRSRPMPDPSQAQNRNGGRMANKGRNEDGLAGDGTTNRRPLFEARAKSTNGVGYATILYPPLADLVGVQSQKT